MKLTVELIARTGEQAGPIAHFNSAVVLTILAGLGCSDSFLNPLKDRELDLRGG